MQTRVPGARDVRQRERQLADLLRMQQALRAPGLDQRQLLASLAGWASQVCDVDLVVVEALERESLVCRSSFGPITSARGSTRPLTNTMALRAIFDGGPVSWCHVAGALEAEPSTRTGMASLVTFALIGGDDGETLGIMTVGSRRADAFDTNGIVMLQMIAALAGARLADLAVLGALGSADLRYRALVEHLPNTAVMVFDAELRLLLVAGPGSRAWRYAERNVVAGSLLIDMVAPSEFAILEPFYRAGLTTPGTIEYHSVPTGLDFHFAAVPLTGTSGQGDQVLVTVTDVTQQRSHDEALRSAEQRYRTAFEAAPVGMAQTSLDGHFEAVNQALCDVTGFSAEQLLATDLMSITHPDDIDNGFAARKSMADGTSNGYWIEKRLTHVDGHYIWVALSTNVIRDVRGRPLYLLSHLLDITARKTLDTQLQYLADHDPLTGLTNRRGFDAALARQDTTASHHTAEGALLVLDLDNFKQINDTLGHSAGDELIIAVANLLRQRLRSTDVIARLGGDEFAVILPYASSSQAQQVASTLLDAVRNEATLLGGGHVRKVTTSIGIAMFDHAEHAVADVLVHADLAMYDAKEAGRDRYATHETSETAAPTTRARLAWVDQINDALEHDKFTLYAQPIMELATRQITRHELLLRMVTDAGDVISPTKFLGVAEKFGLVSRIDRWVVDHAIAAIAADPHHALCFEVNLSGTSMGDPELLEFIERRLRETPSVQPSQLIFEVTETAAVANLSAAREFADRLSALGCSFALDDFGAGFGSFYYLKYLPFDDLKIDGEFIMNCLSNPTDRLVIDTVVNVARGLGKKSIAEYVGDEATLEFLAERGVDFAQGFHVGHPAPLADVIWAMWDDTGDLLAVPA